MVFGIGDGDINIWLPKTTYQPGELVQGKITISLKNPREGRELRVDVYGESEETEFKINHTRAYILRQMVAGERTYKDGDTFEFSFILPANIGKKKAGGLHLGAFQHYTGEKPSKWFVQAALDVPLFFDISHRIGIKIKP